jgi:hypothetical protein
LIGRRGEPLVQRSGALLREGPVELFALLGQCQVQVLTLFGEGSVQLLTLLIGGFLSRLLGLLRCLLGVPAACTVTEVLRN